ncbi:sugar ABC transporter ATP-binding protein [Pseudolactococcus yaeyamensis]
MKNIIEFNHIGKTFPGVRALNDISFSVKKGEVHALLGENGAGKSTLLNILHGIYPDYDGEFSVEGEKAQFKNATEAINYGISKVHQEVSLIPELTVAQNIVLGYEPKKKSGLVDKALINKMARELLDKLKCHISEKERAGDLSTGQMQMVAIAKALYHKARIISLDEPTASLSRHEINALFDVLADLKKEGITLIYVSHKLDEIFQICDQASIFRDGEFVKTVQMSEINEKELIQLMVGRDVASFAKRQRPAFDYNQAKKVLEVKNICKNGQFQDISFVLHQGEIISLSGLVGAKRTEIVRSIFGAESIDSGEILIRGKPVKITTPKNGLEFGIGLIPEDRKRQGFLSNFNNMDNISITKMDKFLNFAFVSKNKKKKDAEKYIETLHYNQKDPLYLTKNLSGGNQQKVVISKWLSSDAEIIILDEPTKGVDINAKFEIYRVLEELVATGKAIIMVSSELPEVIGLSDKVLVIREGKKVAEMENKALNEEILLQYAMGVS